MEFLSEFLGPVFLGAGHEDLAVGAVGALEQGEKSAAALDVEFAHDVVDQQDRRRSVDAGEVFGLGHFQGDGEGALLAFAAIVGGGLFIQMQQDIVAMRADNGRALTLFPVPGLRQLHGKVALHTGAVFHAQFLGVVRDPPECQARQRREPGEELLAKPDQLVAAFHQFPRKTVQGGRVDHALFEDGVAGAHSLHVALQEGQITGVGLGEEQVDEAAPDSRRALDELQILGAEDDDPQSSEEVGEFSDGLGIQGQFAFFAGPVHLDFAFTLSDDAAADEVAGFVMSDHLGAADAAEGTEGGEEIDRLQNVGLALRIVSEQHVEARLEVDVEPAVVAKVAESQMFQVHGWSMPGRASRRALCRRAGSPITTAPRTGAFMPELQFKSKTVARILEGGVVVAEALGLPETNAAADSRKRAIEALRERVRAGLGRTPAFRLHERVAPEEVELDEVVVSVAAPKRSIAWEEPVQLRFDVLRWSVAPDGFVAFVPELGIQVLANRAEDLPGRVEDHIRFAMKRDGLISSLWKLAGIQRTRKLELVEDELRAKIRSPVEAAGDSGAENEEKSVLEESATELKPESLDPAYEVESEVGRLADALGGRVGGSVLLVGPSGCGKTAIVHELVRNRGRHRLGGSQFWESSGSRLAAGQSGFGMWRSIAASWSPRRGGGRLSCTWEISSN